MHDMMIFAEGRITEIQISPDEAQEIKWLEGPNIAPNQPNVPVLLKFVGPNNYYIYVYDHRKLSRKAFQHGPHSFCLLFNHRQNLPCLGRYAMRKGQYIALTDIDGSCNPDFQPITDSGEDCPLILSKIGKFSKEYWRVAGIHSKQFAIHQDSKICLCERRKR